MGIGFFSISDLNELKSCIFCQIITKKSPASFIYEDKNTLAFLDINPINDGHVLIMPKAHKERFCQLTNKEAGNIFQVGRKILQAIQNSKIKCEGANLYLCDGQAAGQEVMHTHLHIAPRFKGDGHMVGFNQSDPKECQRAKLDQIATSIKTS